MTRQNMVTRIPVSMEVLVGIERKRRLFPGVISRGNRSRSDKEVAGEMNQQANDD